MNGFVGYNIIGDIHGMDVWKSLVKDDCINVFVGDFFDSYTSAISYEQCVANFKEVIDFKKNHPETIILYGNHELQYITYGEPEIRHRFDENHAAHIQQLLKDHASFFNGIAYSINNQYLITHAGVSRYWYHQYFGPYNGQTPDKVAMQINTLWKDSYRAFCVLENKRNDSGLEEGPTQSPLWIRPYVLDRVNLFEGTPYKQVFGHTICRQIKEKNGLICIDCLRWMEQFEPGIASLIIN